MEVNKNVFRSYDIRGIAGEELTEEFAELLGKTFGSYIQDRGEKEVIVGHDCRESADYLVRGLEKGLISTGVKVYNIGLVTTPMVYYSRKLLKIGPAIQVTASHNPKEYNGFKMCVEEENESIYGDRILEIYDYMVKGKFIAGNGSKEDISIKEAYIEEITKRVKLGNRKIKAVVDCANATASIVSIETIEKLGVEVIPLYCNIDPTFPNHHPDPSVEKNMIDLANKVKETGADVGFGFDGDGDRIGVVDDKGNMIFGDMYMLIMWREVIKNNPNANALVEVKCSQKLWDELEKIGAKPEFVRTGNPYIKAKMKENNVPFSGEMSGHIFFRDEYYGFDDALYAAARFLRMLSNTDMKVSDMLKDTKNYVTTPEITKNVEDDKKFDMIEKAVNAFKMLGYNVVDVDGARVIFENGWGLIRASNTSPKVTMRFEATSQEELEKIQKEFEKVLDEIASN